MANEAILLRDGFALSSGDYRNSTNSGTTHSGPNGSAQYQAVRLSTTAAADHTVGLTTVNGQQVYGILQNKPGVGDAADVAVFGISKAVAGATSVVTGVKLMADSSGCLIAYASAAGVTSCGMALTTPAAAGEVFTAYIWGAGPGSVA